MPASPEQRTVETLRHGEPRTPFKMGFGDRVRIEMKDGEGGIRVFGAKSSRWSSGGRGEGGGGTVAALSPRLAPHPRSSRVSSSSSPSVRVPLAIIPLDRERHEQVAGRRGGPRLSRRDSASEGEGMLMPGGDAGLR